MQYQKTTDINIWKEGIDTIMRGIGPIIPHIYSENYENYE